MPKAHLPCGHSVDFEAQEYYDEVEYYPPDFKAKSTGRIYGSVVAEVEMAFVSLYDYNNQLMVDDYDTEGIIDYDLDSFEHDGLYDYEPDEFYVECPHCGYWSHLDRIRVTYEEGGVEVEVDLDVVVAEGDGLADFFSTLVQKTG